MNLYKCLTLFFIYTGFIYSFTINVPENFPTIQEAIDYSIDGDSIFVSEGTYYENLDISNKTVIIIGEDKYTTILDSQGGRGIMINNTDPEDFEIHNFTIKNGDVGDGSALYLNALESGLINNCIIRDNIANNSIIRIDNIPDMSITKTLIHNNTANNSSNSYGAIVTYDNVNLNLDFTTLAYNTRGGILTHEPNTNITINNSIFWNPDASEDVGRRTSTNVVYNISYSSFTIDLYENYCISDGYNCLGGIINGYPQFIDNDYFGLHLTSSCIDTGDPSSELDLDGSIADMGALYYDQSYGCTDIGACNYNEYSLYDDGTCIYSNDDICYGCTNIEAINYNEYAEIDDGSCIIADIIVPDDYSTIQQALNVIDENQIIYVRAGIYYENLEWPNEKYVKLIGENRETTIIDGNENGRVIYISTSVAIEHNTEINGFTLQNGYINSSVGSGLYANDAHPSLKNLIVQNNTGSGWNQGIFLSSLGTYESHSEPDTIIVDNVIVRNHNSEAFRIQYNQMTDNWGYGLISINNLEIYNNHNDFTGYDGAALTIEQKASNVEIVNSKFFNNSSLGFGAALNIVDSDIAPDNSVKVINSVFTNNFSFQSPNVISADKSSLINSIVYFNGGTLNTSVDNIINSNVQYLNGQPSVKINSMDSDPLFQMDGQFILGLESNSICIDSGTDFYEINGEILYELSSDEYEGFAPDIGPWETSQIFVPDPIITSVMDVPDDQGGRVYLDFQRSFHDKNGLSRIESYQIDRYDNNQWVGVATQNAYNDSTYRLEVTTLVDSSSISDGLQQYRVIANMEEGNFLSDTVQGYSVDNIIPGLPQNFTGYYDDTIFLTWDQSSDEDFQYFSLYRDNNFIGNTTDNTFNDTDDIDQIELTYQIVSHDVNGNQSESISIDVLNTQYTIGDINEDNIINVLDVIILVNVIFDDYNGGQSPSTFVNWSSDVNQDNQIDVIDIVNLVNLIMDINF